ncbi:MAG: family 10 glycosylhydrolase [Ardenticatenaceae bacterium]|nr:family 10 glycosylhydrolase [Ardenticatenaceae bacterium]
MHHSKTLGALAISLIVILFMTTSFLVTAQTLLTPTPSPAADVGAMDNTSYLPYAKLNPTPTPTPSPTPQPTSTPQPTPIPTQPGQMVEVRGLWVSRFDWTSWNGADPNKIDEIVNNAAYAGFNVIYFQVRGEADAFYTPGLEPWSRRLTGTLGQNPGWDPLARLIEKAHAKGIQVHAYLNIYPVWAGCTPPPSNTVPQHLYHKLLAAHGSTNGKNNGLQWSQWGTQLCNDYLRATPASVYFDNHVIAVATDLVNRYQIDGIHLDHIRYGQSSASYDPVSNAAYEVEKDQYTREDWQRRQVNGTVYKFYTQVRPLKNNLWLSAAVWPIHADKWGWGATQGYHHYYQDSKAWVQGEYIDSISPMIYPGSFECPDDSFWTYSRWSTLVQDFQNERGSGLIVPGIGSGYCSFSEIEQRINRARELGTAGHAIFSYGGLVSNGYFDDLRNGPYAQPASVPQRPGS